VEEGSWRDFFRLSHLEERKVVLERLLEEASVERKRGLRAYLCDETYEIFWSPKYVVRRLLSARSLEYLKFDFRGARKVLGHIKDFA